MLLKTYSGLKVELVTIITSAVDKGVVSFT
jgi:hypothetical protein